jgi:hypothetical protein
MFDAEVIIGFDSTGEVQTTNALLTHFNTPEEDPPIEAYVATMMTNLRHMIREPQGYTPRYILDIPYTVHILDWKHSRIVILEPCQAQLSCLGSIPSSLQHQNPDMTHFSLLLQLHEMFHYFFDKSVCTSGQNSTVLLERSLSAKGILTVSFQASKSQMPLFKMSQMALA